MPAFEYQAVNANGKNVKGFLEGDSAKQIRQILREKSLIPVSVEKVRNDTTIVRHRIFKSNFQGSKISSTELALVTRQFATLLDSGLTIEEVLNILIAQSESYKTKSILSGIRSNILSGLSLVDAINDYPRSFPEIYRSSIAAGERSGNLATVMDNLANYLEEKQSLQQRLGVALIYPLILTIVSILIVIALLTFVVPKVVAVFEDANQTLPLLTRVMIGASDFLKDYGVFLVVSFVIITIGLILLFRKDGPRLWLDGLTLKIPMVRQLSREINSARLARTLAIMIQSGVPLLTAMRSSEGVVSNRLLQDMLRQSAQEVTEGSSINKALLRHNRFSPLLSQMIASGEASGRLGEMLEKAANALETGVKNRLTIIMGLFEPMVILFMGGMVMLIVLAILLPIFDMNTLIK